MAPDQLSQLIAEALAQYESLSLILLAIAFATFELVLPHHPVNRRKDVRLDVLGVVAGVGFVAISYGALRGLGRLADGTTLLEAVRAARDLPSAVKIPLVIVLVDFSIYWLHWLMHRWSFAWRMHRWHHSIEEMYWFAGFRASFLHILLFGIPQIMLPLIVFDLAPSEMAVAIGIGNFVQIWTHTNLKADIGPLAWLIVTPDYHRIHHRAGDGPARNLGNVVTIWDRLFGTYEATTRSPVSRFGLVEPRPGLLRMLLGV